MRIHLKSGGLISPIFAPGISRRMWQRVWPALCFYVLAVPADLARSHADDAGGPVHAEFGAIQRVLFTTQPTHLLQDLFAGSHFVQAAATEVYMSWFLLPITAAIPVLLYRPDHYPRFIAYLLLTYYAVVPLFYLYPLQPPWLQDHEVLRVVTNILPQAAGKDPNPYAAMPSLHVALPLGAAFWYGWRYWFGKVMFAYAGLLGAVVVFTGDHYVVDVAGSFILCAAMYLIARAFRLPVLTPGRLTRGHFVRERVTLPDARTLGTEPMAA